METNQTINVHKLRFSSFVSRANAKGANWWRRPLSIWTERQMLLLKSPSPADCLGLSAGSRQLRCINFLQTSRLSCARGDKTNEGRTIQWKFQRFYLICDINSYKNIHCSKWLYWYNTTIYIYRLSIYYFLLYHGVRTASGKKRVKDIDFVSVVQICVCFVYLILFFFGRYSPLL